LDGERVTTNLGHGMGAFIGDVGVWASNRESDAFLDWFAENRCAPGDPRWEYCRSEGNRWTGCCIELENIIPVGEVFVLSDDEYDAAAGIYGPHIAQLLGIIESITRGEWQIRCDNKAATRWRRPKPLFWPRENSPP
jgi:hypothetical protein